jgi:hypothetical protein
MWTTGLEATPKGTELGSSSSFALRLIKTEFVTMLSLEHIFDSAPSPEMAHIAGNCTVCGIEDGLPTPLNIAGSLWWDYDNKRLYRDAGGGAGVGNPIVSFVHADLDNLTSATAHANYVLVAGDTIQSVVVPTLEGLSQDIADYTDSKYVLSQGAHLNSATPHDAGAITFTNFTDAEIGLDKMKVLPAVTVYSGAIQAGTVSSNILIGRYAFWPYFGPGTQTTGGAYRGYAMRIRPMLNANPPTDYVGGFRAHATQNGNVNLMVNKLEA